MWYDGPEPWIDYYAGEPGPGPGPYGPTNPLASDTQSLDAGLRLAAEQQAARIAAQRARRDPPTSLAGMLSQELIGPGVKWQPVSIPEFPAAGGAGAITTAEMGLTPQENAVLSQLNLDAFQREEAARQMIANRGGGGAGQPGPQPQARAQADSAAIAQRATPGTTSSDDAWWKEFTAVHGETPQQFYSRRENWKPGSTSWQDNVAFDTKLQANFREATGKSEMTDVDWKRAYGWWRSGYSLTPMDPRLLGHRPGGGGGGAGAPSPNATPASQQVTPYEIPAAPYVGAQNRLTIPNLALGELSRQGRDAFGNILTGAGWAPTGVMGAYGPSEYRRETPSEVWFPRSSFPASPYGQEAAWGFGELGWAPRIARP